MSNGYDGKERFAMSSESGTGSTSGSSSIKFKESKGVFLSRAAAVLLALIAVACVIGVGVIVAYTKPGCDDASGAGSAAGEPRPEAEAEPSASRPTDVRLPRGVVPLHYNVELRPNLDPTVFKFDGWVEILIECRQPTDNVTMHVNKLTTRNGALRSADAYADDDTPTIASVSRDDAKQFLIYELRGKLHAGRRYWIRMDFEGDLEDDLVGLYRSKYTTSTGEVR
ncbi:PREDICTED: aminopeptidase N-like [Priapulus caudatus]|uniref:Aminopeptidase N-like n=1 Tax=Priapulus caudatus TaxID=37621 RepID=A0ABM1EAY2_PRICU|nr:PREDICTED: aminopeptidase N-like [Priapulus caudatus]